MDDKKLNEDNELENNISAPSEIKPAEKISIAKKTPEQLDMDELKSAQEAASNKLMITGLMENLSRIGSAYASRGQAEFDPRTFETAKKLATKDVDDIQQRVKEKEQIIQNQTKALGLATERDLSDPVHPISELARNKLKKAGIEVPANTSAAQIKALGFKLDSLVKNGYQLTTEVDPITGKTNNAIFDKSTGKIIPTTSIHGYSPKLFTDTDTGEKKAFIPGTLATTGRVTKFQEPVSDKDRTDVKWVDLSPQEKKEVDKIKKDLDKSVEPIETTLSQLDNIQNLIASKNPAATGAIVSLMSRGVAGEKGVLTDKDTSRLGGSQALMDRFIRYQEQILSGKLDKKTAKDYNELVALIEKRANEKLDIIKEGKIAALSERIPKANKLSVSKFLGTEYVAPTATITENKLKDKINNLSEKDKKALEWAKNNLTDDRAKEILKRLGL